MLRKVIIQTQFGSPHSWTAEYLDHFQKLADAGWRLLVFTPNALPSSGNVEIVQMTLLEFDALVERHCGVNPGNYIDGPAPKKVISDYYCAHGAIFSDYLADADYWGISNWDCCYGRLSRYVPDSLLEQFDIWADDASPAINGIFSVFKNVPRVNRLYEHVPGWQGHFANHAPCAFDEILMTHAVRELSARGEVAFGYPEHFPYHSYDRLVQHRPKPNLYLEADGALIERFEDTIAPPATKDHYGREIFMFHFSRTKAWPL